MMSRISCLTYLISSVFVSTTFSEEKIRFNRDIRPILSDNCYYCHGPDKETQEADLRLDTFEGATRVVDGVAAIVPGDPEASELIYRIHDTGDLMPPEKSNKVLTKEQKELLSKWITQGAEYEPHWSFLALEDSPLPEVNSMNWVKNGIDSFILRRLETEGVAPSPEAEREVLIRRLYLDLLGLLPEPEAVQAFLEDKRPDAYEQLVDSLLANPHYGERWGRHWLDQARYADSNGYSIDSPRQMWPYRDWVIHALNDDMPFDQFTIEQIAGDLLDKPTKSQLIATAYHRNTLINQEGGVDREQFRVEAAIDRTNTTGAVWLGLTLGCAQCHTHKFDPIQHREYFEMYAFFNNGTDQNNKGKTVIVRKGEVFGEELPEKEGFIANIERSSLKERWEKERLSELLKEGEANSNSFSIEDKKLFQALKARGKRRTKDHHALIEQYFKSEEPRANLSVSKPTNKVAELMIMEDNEQPRKTFLLTRGDFTRPDHELGELYPGGLSRVQPPFPAKKGRNRLDLAHWLVHPENPLTSRVTMNRIWMRYFGRGLVETEEDFGTQGSLPSHPELLDWLGLQFIESKWSMKAMHRLIVCSATYRQKSDVREDLREIDPRNILLARQSRNRVEAEIVRDAALCASGELNPEVGGPSVFPEQPEGVYAFTQRGKPWNTSKNEERYRRAMYTAFYRSAPYPLFTTFDAPDFSSVCTKRVKSNTPLQALNLTNDPVFMELARAMAVRLGQHSTDDVKAQIEYGFQICYSRRPSAEEVSLLEEYLNNEYKSWAADSESAATFAGEAVMKHVSAPRGATLVSLARVLINTDNFITRE